ncbi:MAG TPA: hypothetical protein VIG36_13395 [Methylocystis sp.]|jgi:hypothetical protein
MKLNAKSGSAIAAAAATLLFAGAIASPSFAAEEAKGHCVGANACKGQGACKGAGNACGGQNACKGQGFTESTAEDCAKVKGAKFEPAK